GTRLERGGRRPARVHADQRGSQDPRRQPGRAELGRGGRGRREAPGHPAAGDGARRRGDPGPAGRVRAREARSHADPHRRAQADVPAPVRGRGCRRGRGGPMSTIERPAAITVRNLTKRYKKSSRPAVDDISFDVQAGELVAFLGPNGAGKTTTISILTTILAKTSGTVTIDGHDLDADPAGVRRRIGIIFQNPSLDTHLSGEENIRLHVALYGIHAYKPMYRLMPAAYRERLERLAKIVGLEDVLF